ncbi:hypothetical protein ACFOLJ_27325 [Rugamonas sp. CCM 8940]|nr:hypothetical protein [Rugamonas sp. CCM 8940]
MTIYTFIFFISCILQFYRHDDTGPQGARPAKPERNVSLKAPEIHEQRQLLWMFIHFSAPPWKKGGAEWGAGASAGCPGLLIG